MNTLAKSKIIVLQNNVCTFRISDGLNDKMNTRRISLGMNPSEYFRFILRKDLGEV